MATKKTSHNPRQTPLPRSLGPQTSLKTCGPANKRDATSHPRHTATSASLNPLSGPPRDRTANSSKSVRSGMGSPPVTSPNPQGRAFPLHIASSHPDITVQYTRAWGFAFTSDTPPAVWHSPPLAPPYSPTLVATRPPPNHCASTRTSRSTDKSENAKAPPERQAGGRAGGRAGWRYSPDSPSCRPEKPWGSSKNAGIAKICSFRGPQDTRSTSRFQQLRENAHNHSAGLVAAAHSLHHS